MCVSGEAKIVGPEFAGRQFVCPSRNLLAKLHDHKLCSPNLFTRQRGRWRFNYSVEAFPMCRCVCECLGKSQDGCQDSSARSSITQQQNLRVKKVHCHWDSLEASVRKSFEILASYHLGKRPFPSLRIGLRDPNPHCPHNCRPLPSPSRAEKSKSRDVFDGPNHKNAIKSINRKFRENYYFIY